MARTDPRQTHETITDHRTWPRFLAALDGVMTACRNGKEWTSPDPSQQRRAAELCRGCQVLDECKAFALADRHAQGVWGGTTLAQRKQLRRQRQQEKQAA